ncbi:MAG TPA: Ku protein [Candidatus Thermoplasmatota archaeon]|nr:Ku protein [Candidatus Thermoplasmatota archaeon]
MRTIWKGSISFGLVNIPVKVVGAVSPKEIHFNLLHEKDGGRIKFKRVCANDDKEVSNDDIVKGFEVSDGHYVTFTDEELKSLGAEASRTIDILDFVPLSDIDPSFFNKPYFLIPDKNAEKAYSLLMSALDKAQRVGIAQCVMRDKEYLVAIRSRDGVVLMETMHHADEMVPTATIAAEIPAQEVDKRQLAMAEQLIESLSADFVPERYKDQYRDRVMAAIERKSAGDEVIVQPTAKPTSKAVDLMSALEKSLADARSRRPGQRPSKKAGKASEADDADEEEPIAAKPARHKPAAHKAPKKRVAKDH